MSGKDKQEVRVATSRMTRSSQDHDGHENCKIIIRKVFVEELLW